ncbi:MAG: tail fiber protein [Actinobacteria bacterium]|nr:tail fiber protein [Actinomycetota bacterium]
MAFLNIAPTGTVLPFAGSTAPEGWLLCDGSAINRTTYATLFAVTSTTYGTGDGSTTFNLPDMRGVFPRGQGTNGTANYGGVTGHTPAGGALATKGGQKTAKNGLANSSSSVSVSSSRVVVAQPAQEISNQANQYFSAPGWIAYTFNTGSSYLSSSGTAAAQTITGDAETTPASLALNYIIKL